MDDSQLLRYSRQIMLPQLGIVGQERLLAGHALILGLGGLGSPVALYLAAAGVGHLTLVDFDTVDLSNLQRQIAHTTDSIGRSKVASAAERIRALNPDVAVTCREEELDDAALAEAIDAADVVLDCSDNFAIRFRLNRLCAAAGTPLVSGAAVRMEGQVAVYPYTPESACYRCLYREEGEDTALTCSENGVLAPVVGMVGTIQATEALKLLAGIGRSLAGRLLLIDALNGEFRTLNLRADPACPVCGDPA
ncbi:MAG: HesA/MoeB/ThiF family protein [Pseudomonadota bacterium]